MKVGGGGGGVKVGVAGGVPSTVKGNLLIIGPRLVAILPKACISAHDIF